jgi:hypothetical protein
MCSMCLNAHFCECGHMSRVPPTNYSKHEPGCKTNALLGSFSDISFSFCFFQNVDPVGLDLLTSVLASGVMYL